MNLMKRYHIKLIRNKKTFTLYICTCNYKVTTGYAVPKIEREGMDGGCKLGSIIVDKNIHWPNGLTID